MAPIPLLTYCTNVHPGETLEEVQVSLDGWTRRISERLGADWPWRRPFPVGAYLSARSVGQLQNTAVFEQFREFLAARDLSIVTLNGFPYGGFHDPTVKRRVYQPDWTDPRRMEFTIAAARLLARLAPAMEVTAISTLAGSFKGWGHDAHKLQAMARNFLGVARELDRLRDATGRTVILSLEPEPLTSLETTDEVIDYFERVLLPLSSEQPATVLREEVVRRHLGVCYDTCHQAVEFEDAAQGLLKLQAAGIRIGKMQLSSALALKQPGQNTQGLAALAAFEEPRYLHQCVARLRDGEHRRFEDLPEFLRVPPALLCDVEEVRSHFHVPVDKATMGVLSTTRPQMLSALRTALEHSLTGIFEVETYTYPLLPGAADPRDSAWLVPAIADELRSLRDPLGAGPSSAA